MSFNSNVAFCQFNFCRDFWKCEKMNPRYKNKRQWHFNKQQKHNKQKSCVMNSEGHFLVEGLTAQNCGHHL